MAALDGAAKDSNRVEPKPTILALLWKVECNQNPSRSMNCAPKNLRGPESSSNPLYAFWSGLVGDTSD